MIALTSGQRAVLRAYGRGATAAQIAEHTNRTTEQVGAALLALCQLNRQYARELARSEAPTVTVEEVPRSERVSIATHFEQVRALTAKGLPPSQISQELHIGLRTVKRYRSLATQQAKGLAA